MVKVVLLRKSAIVMNEREAGIERLYPRLLGRMGVRYHYLIQLRKKIEFVFGQYFNFRECVLADYGCGNKPYEPIIRPHIKEYIGLDLEENPTADIPISPEGNIFLPDESVDVVLSTQVLEHVVNPALYLSESFRILKKGGKIVLSTHGYWMYHPDPTDYWRWTSSGLKKVISEAGFELKYFSGILGRAAMGMQLLQDGLLFKFPRFTRPLFALFFQPQIWLLDQLSSQSSRDTDACTYILVAEKPL